MALVQWIIGGFQRIQSAFNGYVYRISPSTDTGPTIVSGLIGN